MVETQVPAAQASESMDQNLIAGSKTGLKPRLLTYLDTKSNDICKTGERFDWVEPFECGINHFSKGINVMELRSCPSNQRLLQSWPRAANHMHVIYSLKNGKISYCSPRFSGILEHNGIAILFECQYFTYQMVYVQ